MKKFLIATVLMTGIVPAMAADLPVKTPRTAAPVAQPYDPWNGFYIGGHGGYGIDTGRATLLDLPDNTTIAELKAAPSGFVGGVHGGWGTRFLSFGYAGLEGDWDYSGVDGTLNIGGLSAEVKNKWLASIRGRAGVIAGPALVYATAGYGWGDVKASIDGLGEINKTKGGAVVGGGLEVPLWNTNWLGRVEYLHYFLSDMTKDFGGGLQINVTDNVSVIRGGLSYKLPIGN